MDKQKNKIADLNKSAIDRLNADKLTKYLQSAQNVSNNLTNWIPKIAEEVSKIIQQYYKSLSEKDIKELADKRFDTLKSLREFCYDKVDYDRTDKKNINHAFEMVVNRGCKAGKMIADKIADLQVKEGELLGTSNKVYPTIRVENKNKKIKSKFVDKANEDKTLIPVNTSGIEELWKRNFAVNVRPNSKGKKVVDVKDLAKRFLAELEPIWNYAHKKQYDKFYSKVNEEFISNLGSISALITDGTIRNAFNHCENNLSVEGKIKKAS